MRIISDRRPKLPGSISQVWYEANKHLLPEISEDKKKANGENKFHYLHVPLFQNGKNNYSPEIPTLKIEKIILGYNYFEEDSYKVTMRLRDLCIDQIGYIPEIKSTPLKYIYFDLKKRS